MKNVTIEVPCPEGMKPVLNGNKIEFVRDLPTTYQEACLITGIKCSNDPLVKLRQVIKACNLGHNFSLTEGEIYYPWVRFIRKNKVKIWITSDEIEIQDFFYKGERFTLVGGYASYGGAAGLGYFYSDTGVGYASSDVGFLGCKDKETAQHVSKYFAKLIFQALVLDRLNSEDFHWVE